MNHLSRLSDAVYNGLCREVGSPIQVLIRREVVDFVEVLEKPDLIAHWKRFDKMQSGSHREGFRFKFSDRDYMFWSVDHKVICDLSQITLYRTPLHTVILMEFEDLQPGFTRLQLMTPSSRKEVNRSAITMNNAIYLSSSLFRTHSLNYFNSANTMTVSSVQHGPCATFYFQGRDNDIAFCLRSHHWPYVASPWIERCKLKRWPPESVLSSIVQEGCHIVPISSMPTICNRDSEWRISFSGAEQKLVYSMNHTQFLCYGLFKIFLKEVINAEKSNSCLCSYFIKTIMFCVFQSNSGLQWSPCHLLECFWACFKLLIHWVYKGECPNFFIPANNMFRVKVVGQTQAVLFDQLFDLYCKGVPCLLLSPSIRKYLRYPIMDRTLSISFYESSRVNDACLFNEMNEESKTCFPSEKEFAPSITLIVYPLKTRLNCFQKPLVQRHLSKLIRDLSWFMLSKNMPILSNRLRSDVHFKVLHMMKLAIKMSCSSEILYLALYYYRVCCYEQSLRCLQKAKTKWSLPYVMYNGETNQELYVYGMAGLSLDDKMRKALIDNIHLSSKYIYIYELMLEQTVSRSDNNGILNIPPLVMLHMLFFLNHHRLGNIVRLQQSLQDLQTLLLFDNGTYVPYQLRDISWQVQGICQEICGNYGEALNSFHCSLQEWPYHKIQKATLSRIQRINDNYLWNS